MKIYKTSLVLLPSLLLATVAAAQEPASTNAATIRRSVPLTRVLTNGMPAEPSIDTLAAGAIAPDFESKDLANKSVRLSDVKQKVMVLDFWATWCGPCMKSLPHTEEVAKRYKNQGVEVLAVCTSDVRAKYESWVTTNQARYPDINFSCELHDRGTPTYDDRASKKLYGVKGIPTQFIIGRDGKIVAVVVGYSDGDARLEAALALAGIKVDTAAATKGEDVLKKTEAEAAHPATHL